MSSDAGISSRKLITEMFSGELYKRNQGRMVRQLTCLAVWVAVGVGVWRFHQLYLGGTNYVGYIAASLMLAAGGWFGYRLVNWPRFADFLISVEQEVNKVSWPTRTELVRASIVVIFCIFFLTIILFTFDAIWQGLFSWLGIS
jgi:preprotein translocase subunit SecE